MSILFLVVLLSFARCDDFLNGGIAIKITNDFMENLKTNVIQNAFDSIKDVNFNIAKSYEMGLFDAYMELLL